MSQIATTIEQSKRLLDAGLDPESADMKHIRFDDEIPAWSLSRLIDLIAETGVPMNYGPMKDSASVLDHAVNALEYQLLHADH